MGKMIDLGKKNEPTPEATAEGKSAQAKNYPDFHVEHDQMPIEESHVGKHVTATVKLHVKGHEVREDGSKHTHFAVKGIDINPEEVAEEEAENEDPNKARHERLGKIKKDYMKQQEE